MQTNFIFGLTRCSNNVIAYIGHTTPTTIRKRKERIRKKLPTDLYQVIFGEKG